MIYTCTVNPSLDYYLTFDEQIIPGKTTRASRDEYHAGGKGINVSIMLNNLQIPSRALGFLGGFTKDFYVQLLQQYRMLQPNFTYVQGNTRINVKIMDGTDTDLNVRGPEIKPENLNNLFFKISRLDEDDCLVFAGYCPDSIREPVTEVLKQAIAEGVKVALDTNPEILHELAPCSPFFVKITQSELAAYRGRETLSKEEVIDEARKLHDEGVKNVIVLYDDRSQAVYVCDQGTYIGNVIRDNPPVSTVGTGDSITAGFIMNYIRSRDCMDSFKFAVSCGSATIYSTGLAEKGEVDEYYQTATLLKVE